MENKPKVLFITHDTTRSGAPLLLLNFIKWLKENNLIDPYIFIARSDILDADFSELGKVFYPYKLKNSIGKNIIYKFFVKIYNSNYIEKLYNYFLKQKVKSIKIDLIYSNTICNGKIMEFLSSLNINQVCHSHEGPRGIELSGDKNFRLVKKYTSGFIACSNFVKNTLIEKFGIESNKISLIYSSINKIFDTVSKKNETSLKEKKEYIIGGSGGLGFGKGVDLIVPLMKNILAYRNDVKFIWVGGSKNSIEFNELQNDIVKNEMSDFIEIVESVKSPVQYYQNFDIFILLSREDSFPLVCLENAIIGNTVLCFGDSGGTTELLDQYPDNIIPFLDIENMAKRILHLLNNPVENINIGLALKEKVLKNYASDISYPLMLDFINKSIKN